MGAVKEYLLEETFSTTCGCYDCLPCGHLVTSDEQAPQCDDCGGETVPADYCSGYCYDYKHENWESDLLPEWLAKVGNPDYLKIEGKAMGWQRREGWAVVPAEWKALYNALTIDGEYRLDFKIIGDEFIVLRYSHDEPTGASFTIEPAIVFEEE
jgi:hypothetical protein